MLKARKTSSTADCYTEMKYAQQDKIIIQNKITVQCPKSYF